VDEVEHSDHTITSTNSKHVTLVGEVRSEDSSGKLLNLSYGLESVDRIEDLYFVATGTSSNDILASSLHELGAVDLARRRRL